MPLTRRSLLAGLAGLTPVAMSRHAPAGGLFLRLAHPVAPSWPLHQHMMSLGDRLREESNYLFDVEVLPAGQIGSPFEYVPLLYKGVLHFALLQNSALGDLGIGLERVGELGIFVRLEDWARYAEYEHDGPMAEACRAQGLVYFGSLWLGPSYLISNRPIYDIGDLAGLKLRTLRSDADRLQAVGGQPVSLPAAETFNALRAGAIDGTFVTLPDEARLLRGGDGFNSIVGPALGGTVLWMIGSPELRYDMGDDELDLLRGMMRDALHDISMANAEAAEDAFWRAKDIGLDIITLPDHQAEDALWRFRDALRADGGIDPHLLDAFLD